MTEHTQTIRENLDFMRALSVGDEVAAARKAGLILTAAGLIYAPASLAAWLGATGAAPAFVVRWVWLAAMVVFFAMLATVLVGSPRPQGVRDRAAGVAWAGIGGAIFSIVIGLEVAANQLQSPMVLAGIPTVILALYGAGWTVAASMSGRRWMSGVALGGFAASVAIAFLVARPVVYLAYAVALLLLTTAPGVVLLARRR